MHTVHVNKRTGHGHVVSHRWPLSRIAAVIAVSLSVVATGIAAPETFQRLIDTPTLRPSLAAVESTHMDAYMESRQAEDDFDLPDGEAAYHEKYVELRSGVLRDDAKIQSLLTDSENKMEGLTARVSFLQSRIVRLEAMGQRIAGMAGLAQSEFDLDTPVGLGGPEPIDNRPLGSLDLISLVGDLDTMEKTMEDRWQKLSAMEALLMGKNIQDKTTPAGMPLNHGWVSSGYGMRTDPFTGRREFHQGIDITGKKNSDILAMASGIVTFSGYRSGYGNLVEIQHGDGYKTRYAHNKKNLVNVGETIEKDQPIAVLGSTGRSTGLHVHFEVLSNNVPVNPRRYLQLK